MTAPAGIDVITAIVRDCRPDTVTAKSLIVIHIDILTAFSGGIINRFG